MCVQVAAARAALPEQVRVVCLPQDDAWFRDSGPTVGRSLTCCWLLVAGCWLLALRLGWFECMQA